MVDYKHAKNPGPIGGGVAAAAAAPVHTMLAFDPNPNKFAATAAFTTPRAPVVKKEPTLAAVNQTNLAAGRHIVGAEDAAAVDAAEFAATEKKKPDPAVDGLAAQMAGMDISSQAFMKQTTGVPVMGAGAMLFGASEELGQRAVQLFSNLQELIDQYPSLLFMQLVTPKYQTYVDNICQVRTKDAEGNKITAANRFNDKQLRADDNKTGVVPIQVWQMSGNIRQIAGHTFTPHDTFAVTWDSFTALFPANWIAILKVEKGFKLYRWQAPITPNGARTWFVSTEMLALGAAAVYNWGPVTDTVTVANKGAPRTMLVKIMKQLVHQLKIAHHEAEQQMMVDLAGANRFLQHQLECLLSAAGNRRAEFAEKASAYAKSKMAEEAAARTHAHAAAARK
jgi:hypothetical protein